VDTKDIADAMIEFASDEELREKYRLKGQKRVKNFNWGKTARETLEVYKKLVAKK